VARIVMLLSPADGYWGSSLSKTIRSAGSVRTSDAGSEGEATERFDASLDRRAIEAEGAKLNERLRCGFWSCAPTMVAARARRPVSADSRSCRSRTTTTASTD
jgi:hypothetical protein